jgi:carbon starvation protein CstA
MMAASEPAPARRVSPFAWLPLLVIGADPAFGPVLWAKWGFLIAFETVRAGCL